MSEDYKPVSDFESEAGTPSNEFDESTQYQRNEEAIASSEQHAEQARKWASENVDVEVANSFFSALHYATKSAENLSAIQILSNSVSENALLVSNGLQTMATNVSSVNIIKDQLLTLQEQVNAQAVQTEALVSNINITQAILNESLNNTLIDGTPSSLDGIEEKYNKYAAFLLDQNRLVIADKGIPANEVDTTATSAITFVRNGTKYVMGGNGKYYDVGPNIMPISYDHAGVAEGYQVTDNYTNVKDYSNDCTQWSANNNVDINNHPTDELFDGIKVQTVVPTTSEGTHRIADNQINFVEGETYTMQVTARSAGYHWLQFILPTGIFVEGSALNPRLGLRHGAILRAAKNPEIIEATSKYIGNGFWEFRITAVAISSGSGNVELRIMDEFIQEDNDPDQTTTFAGDGIKGFDFAHMQFVTFDKARPPIVTGATELSVLDDRATYDLPTDFLDRTASLNVRVKRLVEANFGGNILSLFNGTNYFYIAVDNATRQLIARTDINGDDRIYGIRRIPENVPLDIRLDIVNDIYADTYMRLFLNGENQGEVVINSDISFKGDWTVHLGKHSDVNSQMLEGVIQTVVITPEIAKQPQESMYVVTAVGPSLTKEDIWGVSEDQFYPAIIARHLGKHVKSYNFGVSGQNTIQQLSNIQVALDTKPHLAIIDHANYETEGVASVISRSSIELNSALKFEADAYVLVPTTSGQESLEIASVDHDTNIITFKTEASEDIVTGIVLEDVVTNVKEMILRFEAVGALVMVLNYPFENVIDGDEPDNPSVSRADERERILAAYNAAIAEGSKAIFNDQFERFAQRIRDGKETLADAKGHVHQGNAHYVYYGQLFYRAVLILEQLKELGFKIQDYKSI